MSDLQAEFSGNFSKFLNLFIIIIIIIIILFSCCPIINSAMVTFLFPDLTCSVATKEGQAGHKGAIVLLD